MTVPDRLVITAGYRHRIDLREIWAHRELGAFLAWRDVSVRYKQTLLGALWVLIQPLFTMAIFTVFFGRLGKVPTGGFPYPVFAFCALLPWQLYSGALLRTGDSLVLSQNLITKIYFPRLIIPIAAALNGLADFGVAFLLLALMLAWYGIGVHVAALVVPLLIVLVIVSALGGGLWLAALNVRYRDVRNLMPFLTQVLLFITPIAYSSSLVPERWRFVYSLNPVVGIVEGFRWALLPGYPFPGLALLLSVIVSTGLLLTGTRYFLNTERTFADVV